MTRILFCSLAFLISVAYPHVVSADLIGSLHFNRNPGIGAVDNVNVFGPVDTRTVRVSGDDSTTEGLIAGNISFLSAAAAGSARADFRSFSANSTFNDVNRFGNSDGSVIAWDFDLTGQTFDDYEFVFDFTARDRSGTGPDPQFFLSFNDGAAQTLDSTDLTTATPGGVALVSSNTANYQSLATIGAGATVGVINVDITSQIQTAIANGGGIRIALVDSLFEKDYNIARNSGINGTITSVPEPSSAIIVLGFAGLLGLTRNRR